MPLHTLFLERENLQMQLLYHNLDVDDCKWWKKKMIGQCESNRKPLTQSSILELSHKSCAPKRTLEMQVQNVH